MEHLKTIAAIALAIFLAFMIDSFVGVSKWLASTTPVATA